MTIRGVDGREPGGGVRSSAGGGTFTEATADPLGCRQLVAPREVLDRAKFGVVEQHLQSLSHEMSMDDS